MSKQSITDLNITRLQEEFASLSLPRYTARQVTEWIYKKRSARFEDMTNISKKNLSLLAEHFDTGRQAVQYGDHIGRRHEEISILHTARRHRDGDDTRRRPPNALRIVSGRLPNELPILYDGQMRLCRQPVGGRDNKPSAIGRRSRDYHQYSIYGYGRTVR